MASPAHRLGERPLSGPPLSLPIGRRRLRLTDRACWSLLGAAMAAATTLILWQNRGTTFSIDQWDFVEDSPGLGARDLIESHNGHLVATTRLAYKAILETIGIGYLPFRVLGVIAVLLAVGALYALMKRRIGPVAALAPAVVLLFFGSTYHAFNPVGFTNLLSIAAGLGALLALERRDRLGDVAACALLAFSLATFGTAVAFLGGAAALVLLGPGRWRRAWTFLIPATLYGAWWLYTSPGDHPHAPDTQLSNVLLIPSYVADSLAHVLAALAGLNYDFADPLQGRNLGWGYILAALAVVALALRVRRGNVPPALWAGLAILLVYWSLLALSVNLFIRPPGALRYLYVGAVGVLLVATAAVTPMRFSPRGLAVLFAVAALGLTTNAAHLGRGAADFRNYSAQAQAQFAALDLTADHVDPGFDPFGAERDVAVVSSPAGIYLEVADSYGSPAFTTAELERQPEEIRRDTDQVLAAALDLGLEPPPPDAALRACRRLAPAAPGGPIEFELPPSGAVIAAQGPTPDSVSAGRFADSPSVELGEIGAGEEAALAPPPDLSPSPWQLSIADAESVRVCAL